LGGGKEKEEKKVSQLFRPDLLEVRVGREKGEETRFPLAMRSMTREGGREEERFFFWAGGRGGGKKKGGVHLYGLSSCRGEKGKKEREEQQQGAGGPFLKKGKGEGRE